MIVFSFWSCIHYHWCLLNESKLVKLPALNILENLLPSIIYCSFETFLIHLPMARSKKSITNHGDLLTSKLCIVFDNMSNVGYNSRNFMPNTAAQMIMILRDSGVLYRLNI